MLEVDGDMLPAVVEDGSELRGRGQGQRSAQG
jgi:hypothetical protein